MAKSKRLTSRKRSKKSSRRTRKLSRNRQKLLSKRRSFLYKKCVSKGLKSGKKCKPRGNVKLKCRSDKKFYIQRCKSLYKPIQSSSPVPSYLDL